MWWAGGTYWPYGGPRSFCSQIIYSLLGKIRYTYAWSILTIKYSKIIQGSIWHVFQTGVRGCILHVSRRVCSSKGGCTWLKLRNTENKNKRQTTGSMWLSARWTGQTLSSMQIQGRRQSPRSGHPGMASWRSGAGLWRLGVCHENSEERREGQAEWVEWPEAWRFVCRAGKHMKVHQVRQYVQEARLERGRKAFWEAALESMMSNANCSG